MSTTPPPAEESLNDPSPSPERVTYSPSPEPEFLSEMSMTRVSTDSYRSRYSMTGILVCFVDKFNNDIFLLYFQNMICAETTLNFDS